MTSSRPYLLRACYEWIIDNEATPYLVIQADYPGVEVPWEHVKDSRIVLNIAPQAIRSLVLEKDYVAFHARFSGKPFEIYAPIMAVSAIYAEENGEGMVFKDETEKQIPPDPPFPSSGPSTPFPGKRKGRPKLTVVK